jgi:hypothetical protein
MQMRMLWSGVFVACLVIGCGPGSVNPDGGDDATTGSDAANDIGRDVTTDSVIAPDVAPDVAPDAARDGAADVPAGDVAGDIADAATSCNAVALGTAPVVNATYISAAPPAAAGGTIRLGRYELTAMTVYGAAPDGGLTVNPSQIAFEVSASRIEALSVLPMSSAPPQRTNEAYATAGTTLTLTETCPGSRVGDAPYSATDADLRLYTPFLPGTVLELRLTRR